MQHLRYLLCTIFLGLQLLLTAQDTLVAEIKIIRTSQGIEVSYSKDFKYSDEEIARFISQVLTPKVKPKENEIKIKKI